MVFNRSDVEQSDW